MDSRDDNSSLLGPWVPNPRKNVGKPRRKEKKPKTVRPPQPPLNDMHPMHRKVLRLYTRKEVSDRIGCSVRTVARLRRSFLDDRQLEYLRLAGYRVAFYPVRREEREL